MDGMITITLSEDELRAKIVHTLRDRIVVFGTYGNARANEIAQFIIDDLIGRMPDQSQGYPVTDGETP